MTAGCPVTGGEFGSARVPLGPDSLTWKLFGDWRGLLQGPWAGSMQNMHPQLGAAVKDHSIFFSERIPRLFRSLYPIGGVVFDGDRAPATGAEVRDYHLSIKGVDDQGRRYSALNPDVFYWAHATFFMGTIRTAEHFGAGLTAADKQQLFDEHVNWLRTLRSQYEQQVVDAARSPSSRPVGFGASPFSSPSSSPRSHAHASPDIAAAALPEAPMAWGHIYEISDDPYSHGMSSGAIDDQAELVYRSFGAITSAEFVDDPSYVDDFDMPPTRSGLASVFASRLSGPMVDADSESRWLQTMPPLIRRQNAIQVGPPF